ncbi:LuxR C-terminal-related transcriptional regulator [Pedobacter sp. MC2016-05]|uniref:LuxR C-terminal-related transcriptional regulator n=1 Tax=Pedobacter sp. MC2016-05 TaxID=2994474 RepID=UPI00224652D3|nr:LuxR C-terminal-related transcriptional regulator [Pedobacter sp. MC2016-05]MCX2475298.1 LuxR C-terminal-related transcriptional regulator [Pedobacter sp. MC2016-05]
MHNNFIIDKPFIMISKRERLILELIAEGLTNQEIALRIFASRRTIEGNRVALMQKTKTKNTAALVAFAFRAGLLV